jgi:activating signal cointegrator complex subunit 1
MASTSDLGTEGPKITRYFSLAPERPRKPKKSQFTHILSIPLQHAPNLQFTIDTFASEVSTEFPDLQIPAQAIRIAACFNLTLGAMALTPETLPRAVELLESLNLRELLPAPTDGETAGEELRVSLQGLSSVGPATKATVLQIHPVDRTGRLPQFATALRQKFIDAGLMPVDPRKQNFHATLVNTLYARERGKKERRDVQADTLDVTDVVEKWKDRVWVEDMELNRVVIYKMGAKTRDGIKGGAGYEVVTEKEL